MRSARRIVVVGTCGSGKTRLAQILSKKLGIVHVELDAIHWGPDWECPEPDDFLSPWSALI